MTNNMKITNLLLAAAVMLGFTSCLGGDSEQIETKTLYQVFNYVEDVQTGKGEIVTGTSYEMELNYTKGILNLSINGIQTSQSAPSYTVSISDIKYSFNEKGEMLINVPRASNGVITITDLKFKYRQRTINYSMSIPVFDITYTINDAYKVRSIQESTFYFGDTKTSIIGSPQEFKTDKSYYCVTFAPSTRVDGKPQARLFMYDAKFAPKMPEMNLMVLELYADFSLDGYTITAPTAKVYTGTVQNPKEEPDYAITNLNLTGKFSTGVEFDYTAAGRFNSSAVCGYDFTEGVLSK